MGSSSKEPLQDYHFKEATDALKLKLKPVEEEWTCAYMVSNTWLNMSELGLN